MKKFYHPLPSSSAKYPAKKLKLVNKILATTYPLFKNNHTCVQELIKSFKPKFQFSVFTNVKVHWLISDMLIKLTQKAESWHKHSSSNKYGTFCAVLSSP